MAYTIKEVEKKTGISAHTIRFWAKEGLFPYVERGGAASVRYFSDKDLEWVAIVHCLRRGGLSIEAIKHYVHLCLMGDETLEQRLEIMQAQREETLKIIESYQNALDKLDCKVRFYKDAIAKRDRDVYNPAKDNNALSDYFERVQGYENFDKNMAKKIAN
ncbi:MerR family transcriptional regulator [Helicobacter jaachi]|uniref:MerR family transcriptional regulator n=1 Tax=Helicobacter jaachi TaxID=1677920 RepID=A0A4U8TC35_9HELI|nr:MerR family transcriptional regulator [Helicobacter jaachi]TLD97489.1 MerR family transcriptional regulator [Helicobacter jaachi]